MHISSPFTSKILRGSILGLLILFLAACGGTGGSASNPTTSGNGPKGIFSAPAGTVKLFSLPDGIPDDITAGPDHNIWFTNNFTNKIGRVTTTGKVTEFAVPTPNNSFMNLGGITAGPDGNLWFTEKMAHMIGRITPDGVITEFAVPHARLGDVQGRITAGPDGNLWFTLVTDSTTGGAIGRITPAGVITEFLAAPIGTAVAMPPFDITAGPDGNLWFTEYQGNTIGRITPTGTVTLFPVNTQGQPWFITTGPDHNLWFTEYNARMVGFMTVTGTVTEFPFQESNTSNSFHSPNEITAGPDGNLWFDNTGDLQIERITPAGVVTSHTVPFGNSLTGITTGPDDNVWFVVAEETSQQIDSKIGYISTGK